MEEKDVTFNIVRMEDDNELQIGVTSDIDDFPDYLEIDEYVSIIATVLSKCINRITGADEENYIPEDFDEDDVEQQNKLDKVHDFEEAIIHLIVNVINNTTRSAFNLKPEELECSTVVYDNSSEEIFHPKETYHSDNITAFDPLQAIYPLVCDTMYCLVSNGMKKKDVKRIVGKSLDLLKSDFDNMLEEM